MQDSKGSMYKAEKYLVNKTIIKVNVSEPFEEVEISNIIFSFSVNLHVPLDQCELIVVSI